ncbi:hypothetical protein EJB05_13953, partial [Eragrostis curvula]
MVERPSKNPYHASGSTSSTSSGPYVCADLLDSLLHEIIFLINSFRDFVAFIGTCRSWRAAISSFPSMYTFSFPPLHLEPDGPYFRPHSRGIKPLLMSNCKCQLSDPSKENLSLRCSVPQNTPDMMCYLGCSYGYLIFTYEEHCLLVDAYTGAKVKAPKLPTWWPELGPGVPGQCRYRPEGHRNLTRGRTSTPTPTPVAVALPPPVVAMAAPAPAATHEGIDLYSLFPSARSTHEHPVLSRTETRTRYSYT